MLPHGASPSVQHPGGVAANLGSLLHSILQVLATGDQLWCILRQAGLSTALVNLPDTLRQSPCS